MKPKLLDRSTSLNKSISFHHHQLPYFLKTWHYHHEYELVFVRRSTGTRFVGDSIRKFQEGDLVLLGEDLPHMWQNDAIYFEKEKAGSAEALVIHFAKKVGGLDLFSLPEFATIHDLLEVSKRGIRFSGPSQYKVAGMLEEMLQADEFDRLVLFLEILKTLAGEKSIELLSSPGFLDTFRRVDSRRLDKIYDHTMHNFKEEISLEQVAELAGMNISAFCRYFKKTTDRTYFQYLNEVRIGFACRLLIEGQNNISEICYASGFNNISNFNRQFKSITKMSPTHYAKIYRAF